LRGSPHKRSDEVPNGVGEQDVAEEPHAVARTFRVNTSGKADHRADAVDLAYGQERSEEHTSELQSPCNLVCRLLLEKKKTQDILHRHFTRRQVAIQNSVTSNNGISQITFRVKVLTLFSRIRRNEYTRKSTNSVYHMQ